MKLLITNVTVCDTQSSYNGKKCDISILNGSIEKISPASKTAKGKITGTILDGSGLFISPGFADMRAAIREPGFEYKETLASAAKAASAGGYTTITCLPDTNPTIQNKADIAFIKRKSEKLPVYILPYAAITHNREGKEMNELYDLHSAGAAAFSDGNRTIMQAGVMERALEYSRIFGGLIIAHAEDTSIAGVGQMHEGNTSTELGLKGIPNMAEELIINRDIELAKYTKAPLHIAHISSKGSVDLIRKAKKQGMPITCDVAVSNLVWLDEALTDFDSNFKLNPPLRSKADQKALWDGLSDGTIDCIVSDHTPEDTEHKNVEFEYAAQGMIQFQTAFSLLITAAPKNFPFEKCIEALTVKPRNILKQTPVIIQKDNKAELVIFSKTQTWDYTVKANLSKSKNSPVLGKTMQGRIIATINKDQIFKHA